MKLFAKKPPVIALWSPFLSLFLAAPLFSQNLVINGGFERQTPKQAGVLQTPPGPCQFSGNAQAVNTCMMGWRTFEIQTPDLLVRDSISGCSFLPAPHSGNRMLGLIMYHPFQDGQFAFDYHEVVQGTLSKPLGKGKIYRISFWTYTNDSLGVLHLTKVFGRPPAVAAKGKNVSPAGYKPVYCGNFGFYFSNDKINVREDFMQSQVDFPVRPQLNVEEIVETGGEWRQITLSFKADQSYKYFLFGNFFSDAVTNINMSADERMKLDERNGKQSFWQKIKRIAYYCFDDFVIEEDGGATIRESLLKEKKYTFPSALLFDSGSSELKSGSLSGLLQLADVLRKNPALHIEIGGHTDNVGDDASNRALSEQRALSVCNSLIFNGVSASQVSWKGYGEGAPVASNATEAGRQQNRRVECRVVE